MLYRIGQLVAPDALVASAYICVDADTDELHLVLGHTVDTEISDIALMRYAADHGLRVELRAGIERATLLSQRQRGKRRLRRLDSAAAQAS